MRYYLFILEFLLWPLLASAAPADTQLGQDERAEVMGRIARFYAVPMDPSAMNHRQPKYDVKTQQPLQLNSFLKSKTSLPPHTLSWLAQGKSSEVFQEQYDKYLENKFPDMGSPTRHSHNRWAAIEANDRVEDLTDGWLSSVTYDLDSIPISGNSDLPLWSDTYWPMKYGLTSYRYGKYQAPPWKSYQEAVDSYAQPGEWTSILRGPLAEVEKHIVDLSPSEKYDLTMGDEQFSLTNQQKLEGSKNLGDDHDVESWMGICHGWAAGSVMAPKPIAPVTLVGARGDKVEWYPADVRAMTTLAWANGNFKANRVGGRCNSKNVETYPNGRIKAQECFDNNPSTFHLVLGNMIGRARASFIMDKAYDYEVWNQPVYSYSFTYFNPLNPNQQSQNWRTVSVPYDANFKRYDRFQHPLTRGVRTAYGYSDRSVKYVVGVIATVTYLVESYPNHAREPGEDLIARETYTYDLELYQYRGRLYPQGGEWHENAHPDFVWLPNRRAVAAMDYDNIHLSYTGTQAPHPSVTSLAKAASSSGYPLCQVVKQLVNQSSQTSQYRCATDR